MKFVLIETKRKYKRRYGLAPRENRIFDFAPAGFLLIIWSCPLFWHLMIITKGSDYFPYSIFLLVKVCELGS